MSIVNIDGDRTSFSYDMKTRDYGWAIHTKPVLINLYEVVEIVPPPNDEFHIKVNMLLLLRKLDVI